MGLVFAFFHFTVDFFSSFLQALSPYLIEVYRLTPREIAVFIAATSLLSSLCQLLFAQALHKFPNQKLLLLTALSTLTLAPVLFALHISLTLSILSFLLIFIANALFHPLGTSWAGTSNRQNGVAFFISGGITGGAVGPIFITWLVSTRGSLALVPFSLSVWLVTMILFAILFKREKHFQVLVSREGLNLKYFRLLFPIWFMVGLRTLFMSGLHTFTPIWVSSLGFKLVVGGSLLSGGVVLGILSNLTGNCLRHKIGNWWVNWISFLGMGTSILLFATTRNPLLIFAFYFLADAFGFLSMSSNVQEAHHLLPNHLPLASSVSMGFAWSFGYLLHLGYSSVFGNHPQFVLYSMGVASLVFALVISIFKDFFGKFSPYVQVSQS
ncbi:MFS transporter [Thermatribacter velox]|uniref:MFS transporter n=1 Tax=Thermatribacter velox TaxID=3039681 RepID=A0ABZ2Y8X8_9BACT